jgi:hypothetical protein
MDNAIEKTKEQSPAVGFDTMTKFCPYGQGKTCLKEHCEAWVELSYGEQQVGRCSVAWQTIIATEQKVVFEKLLNKLEASTGGKEE